MMARNRLPDECRRVRDRLERAPEKLSGHGGGAKCPDGCDSHLDSCPSCAAYAGRLHAAIGLLREHHGNVEPDAAFAGRVTAHLRQQPAAVLGWAALRLLPLSLALVLVLVWLSTQVSGTTPAQTVAQAPTDDVLTWIIETEEGAS
jgi:hypothetical protein